MPAHLDPPPYDKDKDFEHQSAEYLEWCLDMADERVMKYASELRFHIQKARNALRYRKATESNVAHLEELVDKARAREAAEDKPYVEENH